MIDVMSEPTPPRELSLPALVIGATALVAAVGFASEVVGQRHRADLPSRTEALPGRAAPIETAREHFVFHTPLRAEPRAGQETVYFGMGCFWGAERRFWTLDGIVSTAAGYMGGQTPNPTYDEVCTGDTGHAEVVRVVFDPQRTPFESLLRAFWEGHDPTQGMRQGNDVGTQYRSAIYTTTAAQQRAAEASRRVYQEALTREQFGAITTEIRTLPAHQFFFAEGYHQQYLAKNPNGYCGHGGTGVSCPIGLVPYEPPSAPAAPAAH